MSTQLYTRLKFPQMVSDNSDNHETAFTVSIDHIDTSTDVSAAERGVTARQCVNALSRPEDFYRPGHMFLLATRENGVLEQNDHTEATVDLMRLAGLNERGLCCKIMREGGTMIRMPRLLQYTGQWNTRITTIRALQDYRKQHDTLAECATVTHMPTRYGTFKTYGYRNLLNGKHHVALVKGEIGGGRDLLCRVHSEYLTGDAFGSLRCGCGQQLVAVMTRIEQEGRGVLLYMHQEGGGIRLLNRLRACELQDQSMDALEANLALSFPGDLRKYSVGAQILRDLDARTLRLLTNNPDKVYQFSDSGLDIKERVPVQMTPIDHNLFYLRTREQCMEHLAHY